MTRTQWQYVDKSKSNQMIIAPHTIHKIVQRWKTYVDPSFSRKESTIEMRQAKNSLNVLSHWKLTKVPICNLTEFLLNWTFKGFFMSQCGWGAENADRAAAASRQKETCL